MNKFQMKILQENLAADEIAREIRRDRFRPSSDVKERSKLFFNEFKPLLEENYIITSYAQ